MAAKSTELCYKGHPLRRKDNLLYYGSMADKYIVMMQILDTKRSRTSTWRRGSPCSFSSKPDLKSTTINGQDEKDGLYNAMDVAAVWLDRALANN